MLKIEPTSLGNSLILKKKDRIISNVYTEIIRHLSNKEKIQAVKIATEFINKNLNITNEFEQIVQNALKQLNKSITRIV